jgi:RimJ/RimL family protein N-acetyltransferase
MAAYVLSIGKKPVWACHSGNIASQKTAERAGFVKVRECRTVRLEV